LEKKVKGINDGDTVYLTDISNKEMIDIKDFERKRVH
jgi:hypothetical protein